MKHLKHMFDCDNLNRVNNRRYLNDIILLAVILVLALCIYLVREKTIEPGAFATVCYSSSITDKDNENNKKVINLSEDRAYLFWHEANQLYMEDITDDFLADNYSSHINDKDNYNIVVINNKLVDVYDASCPDRICVNTKAAKNNGDSIICLPNKLIINIENETNSGDKLDAVTW